MDLTVASGRGYDLCAAPLQVFGFHAATRFGAFVFTSGQTPSLGDIAIKGKVGDDVDIATAQKAAEICAVKCLQAALAVADAGEIARPVKVLGLVNVAPGFDNTSAVINGATDFLNSVFPGQPSHARTAVGAVLPSGWAVEVEIIFALTQ